MLLTTLENAACVGHWPTFAATFIERTYDSRHELAAKAICATCPELVPCHQAAHDEPLGVYGGTSGWERHSAHDLPIVTTRSQRRLERQAA